MTETTETKWLPILPIDHYQRGVAAAGEDCPFDARVLRYYEVDGLPYLDLAPEHYSTEIRVVYEACAAGVNDPGRFVGHIVDVNLGDHVHEETHARFIKTIEFI